MTRFNILKERDVKEPFIPMTKSVIDSGLSSDAFYMIAVGMNTDERICIDKAYLQRRMNLSHNTVSKVLDELKQRGFVAWKRSTGWQFANYPRFLDENGKSCDPDFGTQCNPKIGTQPSDGLSVATQKLVSSCDPDFGTQRDATIYTKNINIHRIAHEDSNLDPEQPAAKVLDDRSRPPSESFGIEDPSPSGLVGEEAKPIGSGGICPPAADRFGRTRYFREQLGSLYPVKTALISLYCDHREDWDELVAGADNKGLVYQPDVLEFVRRSLAASPYYKGEIVTTLRAKVWLDDKLLKNFDDIQPVLNKVALYREERDRRNRAATYSTAAVALDPNESYF